ncbi:hypothetical protein, partial [Acidithiobacillus ferriphilus]|uniref:hypothetical protein n=1 Tax=Acidithiobacillus ferriphilus TaxID=1689834 RepID=UPI002DBD7A13
LNSMERAESSRNSDLLPLARNGTGRGICRKKRGLAACKACSLQGLPMARNILTISRLETRRNSCHDHQKIDLQSKRLRWYRSLQGRNG